MSSENVISRFCNHFWIIQGHHGCKMCSNYPWIKWNQRFRDKKTRLKICHHMLTSSSQLQNRSFHVVERTRTSTKCQKMKNARAKRANLLFFTVKYANLWRSCCRCCRSCVNSLLRSCNDYLLGMLCIASKVAESWCCNWTQGYLQAWLYPASFSVPPNGR